MLLAQRPLDGLKDLDLERLERKRERFLKPGYFLFCTSTKQGSMTFVVRSLRRSACAHWKNTGLI